MTRKQQETIQLVVNSMGDVDKLGRFAQSVDPIALVRSWMADLQAILPVPIPKAVCPDCQKDVGVRDNNTLFSHRCKGGYRE